MEIQKLIKKHKKIFTIITIIIITGLIGFYLYSQKNDLNKIKDFKFIYLIPLIILTLINLVLNGVFLKIITNPFNIKLQHPFLLSISSSFFNLITPLKGGAGIRAIYMKKKYNLSYSEFISSLFGSYIIVILNASLIALIVFLIIYIKYNIYNIYFNIIFASLFLISIFIIKINFKLKESNSIFKKINKIHSEWKKIKKHPRTINKLILNSLIRTNFFKALYFSTINIIASFINLTPGSLGINEILYAISAKTLEISPAIGMLISIILRLTIMACLLSLGPIANYILFKKLKNSKINL